MDTKPNFADQHEPLYPTGRPATFVASMFWNPRARFDMRRFTNFSQQDALKVEASKDPKFVQAAYDAWNHMASPVMMDNNARGPVLISK